MEAIQEKALDIVKSVLGYANGGNPDGRNFFTEMDQDEQFQKSYKKFEAKQKKEDLSDVEVMQAQLINMLLEESAFYQGTSGSGHVYYDESLAISPKLLRAAGKTEVPRLIKNLRWGQLREFAQVGGKDRPGIMLRHIDDEYKLKDKERADMQRWERILANEFFFIFGPNRRANLGAVLGAFYEDWFDYDKVCFYVDRTLDGKPLRVFLFDPEAVKTIVPKRNSYYRWDQEEYVQAFREAGLKIEDFFEDDYRYLVIDKHGRYRAKFTDEHLITEHYFKTTSADGVFRGQGIIEQSVRLITSFVNSIELNASRMSRNVIPQSILILQGAGMVNQQEVSMFKKLLWAQMRGPSNNWKIPIVGLPEKSQGQLLHFHDTSKDMEFYHWISLIGTCICYFSGTDPREVGLASNQGVMETRGSMFSQGVEGTIRRSKDTGLRIPLSYFCSIMNRHKVISELTGHDDWILSVSGLDVRDEKEREELAAKRIQTSWSINNLLVENDREPFEMMLGDVNIFDIPGIANATISQLILQALQMKQQEDMMLQQQQGIGGGEEGFTDTDRELMNEYGEVSSTEGEEGESEAVKSKEMSKSLNRIMFEFVD